MPLLLGDRYRVGERIGTGGSSHVYEAFDERLGRPVAVKLLDEAAAATADPAARRRFESESRTAAQFFHPNAVAVLDAGSDQGNLFLVMELVTGGSLAQRLAEGPTLSIGLTKRLLNAVEDATVAESLETEAALQDIAGRSEDHAEGVAAFGEKRDPRFTGR